MRYVPSERLRGPGTDPALLPPGFRQEHSHEAFVERETTAYSYTRPVQAGPAAGMRFNIGPLISEHFTGEEEPAMDALLGPKRNICWQPLYRHDIPEGWTRQFIVGTFNRIGFAVVEPSGAYDVAWTQHARRHKRRWEKQENWVLRDITLDEFIRAYWKSPKDPVLKFMMSDLLKKKVKAHGPRIRLVAAVKKTEPDFIGAAFAFTDVPELSLSSHTISFVRREAEAASAGTGLIDAWFRHAQERGIKWLNFGNFWAPGSPGEWVGFSEFKSQFGVFLVDRPPRLVKRVGTWKGLWEHLWSKKPTR